MEIQHSFIKGMNRDFSKDKFPHDAYYYLLNGRILNDDNSTLSDIINLKGNTNANIFDNELIRDSFSIIGYTLIQNDIILFYAETTATGVDSVNTYSIIDRLIYEGNNSYTRTELLNKQGLNFRVDKKIKALARRESDDIEKIYWIDNNNFMRQANVSLTDTYNTIFSLDISEFDIIGDFNSMFAPSDFDYTSGVLKSGSIAYAYRLIKKNGYKTLFSEVSDLIPIGRNINYNASLRNMYGDGIYDPDSSYNTGKGLVFAIYMLNGDYDEYYDYIEIVSLWYSSNNAIPDINITHKIEIQSGITTYRIIDTGTTSYGTLTLAEFIDQQYSLKAKDMEVKDNRLFLANVEEEYFDVDDIATWTNKQVGDFWDARSYRFDNDTTPKSQLLNTIVDVSPQYTIYSDTLLYSSISESVNAINVYNNISSTISSERNFDNLEQKYQLDGSTIGGSGPNITYHFEYEPSDLISQSTGSPLLDGYVHDEEQLGIYKTFQRDEVYRFGIVFYDLKGRQSFVKWIGDIRIPAAEGASYPGAIVYPYVANDLTAVNIYPVFTISNIPTINEINLDYQIVYVKREEKDKSIIASGLITTTTIFSSGTRPSTQHYRIGEYVSNSGTGDGNINKLLVNFISPEINFRYEEYFSGTYLHFPSARLGSPEGCSAAIADSLTWGSITDNEDLVGDARIYIRKYDRLFENQSLNPQDIRVDIVDFVKSVPSTSLNFYTNISVDTYANYGYADNGGSVSAPHGTCLTIRLDEVIAADAADTDHFYAYLRKSVYQSAYGGLTYNSRQSNTYIPVSKKISGNTGTVTCKYGDTFVTSFEYGEFFIQDIPDGASNSFGIYNYIPCESSINCLFNTNDTYSRKYFVYPQRYPAHINESAYVDSTTGLSFTSLYGYNSAYNKLEDSKKFVCKPVLFENILYNLSRIRYSDLKIENEDIDSWLIFRSNNFKDANENYGSINKLVEFNDRIFSFQDNAVSVISINPRVTQQSTDGVSIILGTGEIIDKFNYLTTNIGCQDNSDIIKSFSALYWLDKNKRKIYTFNGQIESITDLKGLHSYLKNNIYENSSFIGTYDFSNSEVLMTITDTNPKTEFLADFIVTSYYDYDGYPGYEGFYSVWDLLGNTSIIEIPFVIGRIYKIGNGWFTYTSKTDTSYRFAYSHGEDLIDGTIYDLSEYITERDNFTIAYNEKLQTFTSFYSFIPDLYLYHHRDYFTSENSRDLWQHNIGEDYNTFYGITYPTTLKIITNLGSQIQAEYTNIKFFSEVWNQYGELIPNETISNISLKDSTQISDDIILYPIHLVEEGQGNRYVLDTSGLRIGQDWYTGKITHSEGLVINNNQLYRNTSIGDLTTSPPNIGWSVAELCNIRKTNNHWMTQLPRFLYLENNTNNHEYALSNRFRSDWLEITLELKDMMPGINLSDRRLRLSDVKLVYTPLQF